MTLKHRLIRDLTVSALVFQLVHFVEHAAQLGYWFAHPSEKPWLTPWAEAGRSALVVDGTPASGNEILHLVGNVIFFAGLIGLLMWHRHATSSLGGNPHLRRALWVQGFHVGEHMLLTGTYLISKTPMGFTTLFGAVSGPFGSTLRVWSHFLLNLVATYLTAMAVWTMYRQAAADREPVRAIGGLSPRPATDPLSRSDR